MNLTSRSSGGGPMLGSSMGNGITPMVSTFAPLMLGPGRNRDHQQYDESSNEPFHIYLLRTFQCRSSRIA
jgi:hypothetical protein